METGETVKVTLGGEVVSLPLTMAVLRALGKAEVCPMYLSGLAGLRGRPMVLDLAQACTVVAIGMQAAGIGGATPEAVWKALRARPGGSTEVSSAALDYLTAFLRDMPQVDVPPGPETPAPKA